VGKAAYPHERDELLLLLNRKGTVSTVANIPDSLYPALRRPAPSFPPGVPQGQAGAYLVLSGPCTQPVLAGRA
jgi:hypothetical protein